MGVQVARRGRITEVELTWSGAEPAVGLTGHGTAYRSKNDVRLDEIGETIAIGRALQDLGYQIECLGHAQCVTKDEFARVQSLSDKRTAARIATGVADAGLSGRDVHSGMSDFARIR